MDGDAIGFLEFLELSGFPAPWQFDGMFVNRELGHIEIRFSCPRGTRHHCTECGVMDRPAHDFPDMVREHDLFLGFRCFVRPGFCGPIAGIAARFVARRFPGRVRAAASRFSSRRFSFICAGRRL